ncbi:MAG: IS110 family transposase [Clostridia bacterium]|nr:IS110 family transposase [Clostridia bacterium]
MYYIGIDISKFKHDCAVIDDAGDVVTPSWSFANDHEGFLQLKALLDSLGLETRIGLESTGHYGTNLKLFLEACGRTFMEFNPLLINRFVKSKSLRKTKTDSIDCEMIARYLMTVEYKPYPPSFYHTEKLKSLTRFRDNLVRQRSRQLVELTNILDKVFPEFKPFLRVSFLPPRYTYLQTIRHLKRLRI